RGICQIHFFHLQVHNSFQIFLCFFYISCKNKHLCPSLCHRLGSLQTYACISTSDDRILPCQINSFYNFFCCRAGIKSRTYWLLQCSLVIICFHTIICFCLCKIRLLLFFLVCS